MSCAPPARGLRKASRHGWLLAAIWLFYLTDTVLTLWHQDVAWIRYLGLAAVAAFAGVYLFLVRMARPLRYGVRPPGFAGRAAAGVAVLLVLFALQIPGAGFRALSCLVYIAAFGMAALPLPAGILLAALLGTGAEVLASVVPGWQDNGYGLAVVLGSLATWGVRLATERQQRLSSAQQEIADLAVQNERARIAADLHDILGHSLTVVTVKAELAQRLLDVDPGRARKELSDLEALARDALADVRSTAMGVRGMSLPGEIAAARAALAAANVEADLPGAADEVPSRNRELFAWTIREAVTNIVRHSKATHARVHLNPGSVEIVDDGVGRAAADAGGQGLAGLRRRADAAGAHLTVGERDGQPGFRVRVEVPT
ncbi:sensor histidine kinase [Mangrovihabitans endophyticus]|uniref:Histidine kinase n=1 Tax=Mangrovihabitans endophyticus TaxID=1751298 RepID=A0A8J3FQT2_9ACTN|nr:sensor histidine kinase [Mangrovihabitans endophyticus]GGL12091.1 histidine kinase [Mangrovihabitans endophyticus]